MAKHSKSNKNIIIKILLILLLLTIIGIVLVNRIFQKDNLNDILEEVKIDESKITPEKTEKILKLEELQKTNPDIIGYIEIEGTNISYPVLHTDNNDYYMTHDYKKEYTKNGSIFLDKDYDWSIPSSNLLIYGHNNKNGTMFEDLLKYKEEDFYKAHSIIKFTTNSEEAEYQIIAAFLSRVYYKSEKNVFRYYFFINAETENDYNEYVESSKKEALYDTGKTAEYGEQLMTLSTCAYHTTDGRFAVVAKKIKSNI